MGAAHMRAAEAKAPVPQLGMAGGAPTPGAEPPGAFLPASVRRWARILSAAIVDQAILSLLSLGLGLAFVRLATKTEYALFAQISAITVFATAAVGSMVISPLTTLLSKSAPGDWQRLATSNLLLQAVLAGVIAAILGVLVLLWPNVLASGGNTVLVAIAVGISVFAASQRDFLRNLYFLNHRPSVTLGMDVAYVIFCGCGVLVLALASNLAAAPVLLGTALIGLLAAMPWWTCAPLERRFSWSEVPEAWRQNWPMARWALPSLVVSSVGALFPLLTPLVVGVEGTAEIVAARLFVQPLGPLFVAWSNVFRPRIGQLLATKDGRGVRRLAVVSCVAIAMLVTTYVAAVLLGFALLERYVLGPAYAGLEMDVAWWGLVMLVAGIGGVFTGILVVMGHYRDCFWSTVAGNSSSLLLLFWLGSTHGKAGVVAAMAMGNVVATLWNGWAMLRGMREEQGNTP